MAKVFFAADCAVKILLSHKSAAVIALVLLNSFAVAAARDMPRDHPKEESYNIVFQEYGRYDDIKDRSRDPKEIIADIKKKGAANISMINAVVELGLHTPADKIPWKMLLEIADAEEGPHGMADWLVITAGKYLCSSDESYELEDWLFNQLRGGRHIDPSIVVLGVSRVSKCNTLREWSRLLRSGTTSAETCRAILIYAHIWGIIYEGGVFDEGVNCILAGYDEENALPERKLMLWEALFNVLDAAVTREGISDRSLWAIRQLGMREFASEKNDEDVRRLSTAVFGSSGEVPPEVIAAAHKIVVRKIGGPKLQKAAEKVLQRADEGDTDQ